jgi:uncharacterized protein (TIGR02996 family)
VSCYANEPFLKAIEASPDDDAPRLVWADYLDETGQEDAARLVRQEIADRRANKPVRSVADLLGKIMADVTQTGDEMVFTTNTGEKYKLYHSQDCCETVTINDVCGDLKDLVGSPLLMAEESTSTENPDGVVMGSQECFTWTFYRFATVKGYVTVRWYGESNGYYSESVDFAKVD